MLHRCEPSPLLAGRVGGGSLNELRAAAAAAAAAVAADDEDDYSTVSQAGHCSREQLIVIVS